MSSRHSAKYRSPHAKGDHVQPMNIQKASQYAAARRAFVGSLCMGRWVDQMAPRSPSLPPVLIPIGYRSYVIFSGPTDHPKPLFVWDEQSQMWFENTDTLYGRVTARQRNRMRPQGEVHRFDTLTLQAIALWGFAHVAKLRLNRKRDWHAELRARLDGIRNSNAANWWRDGYGHLYVTN